MDEEKQKAILAKTPPTTEEVTKKLNEIEINTKNAFEESLKIKREENKGNIKKYLSELEGVVTGMAILVFTQKYFIEFNQDYIEVLKAGVDARERMNSIQEQLIERLEELNSIRAKKLNKYVGKKIKSENQKMYDLISKEEERRKKMGLPQNTAEAVNVISSKKKLSTTQRDKLYRNYVKYKNTTIRKVDKKPTLRILQQ